MAAGVRIRTSRLQVASQLAEEASVERWVRCGGSKEEVPNLLECRAAVMATESI